jgi:3'-phosphoadenosine 5'-phosphosulfate sulfotransferase (PAPS reductase)/FAD synthetase
MRVISLGAGVQSTTLLLLAHRGELPGGPVDYAIFADTGWEPAGVYRHLA